MEQAVIDAMNEQINFEMYSGYVYLQMSLLMEKENYKGYSDWLFKQYKEEFKHAEDFMRFLQKRDVTPTLKPIEAPKLSIRGPLNIAKMALEHEKKVTGRIYKLHDLAKKNDDYATEIFMHSYISEQIEEEDIAKNIVDKFTLAGDSTAACYAVDRELAGRID